VEGDGTRVQVTVPEGPQPAVGDRAWVVRTPNDCWCTARTTASWWRRRPAAKGPEHPVVEQPARGDHLTQPEAGQPGLPAPRQAAQAVGALEPARRAARCS
jgi:hypothetical protein